jgi:hypothetical protein
MLRAREEVFGSAVIHIYIITPASANASTTAGVCVAVAENTNATPAAKP